MKKTIMSFAFAAVAAAALTGCCSHLPQITENAEYKIIYAVDDNLEVHPIAGEKQPFIQFSIREGQKWVSGLAGDNRFFGPYQLNKDKVRFDRLGVTRMAGPNMAFEQAFLEALNDTDRIESSGNALKFFDDNELVIYAEKQSPGL